MSCSKYSYSSNSFVRGLTLNRANEVATFDGSAIRYKEANLL